MILLLLLTLQIGNPAAPSELADMATEFFQTGQYKEASEIWNELLARMPHRSRIAYNLAASLFLMDSPAEADSILTLVSDDVDADTLACAVALTDLALAIQMEDYGGVENNVNTLIEYISDGVSLDCERIGLEAGLNWLQNHDPPEDQQDQNEDQQDQNEDQQDQNEDQQDQNEDQQDQNEDQQDQNEDQQDQSQNEELPQPPPQIDEMTPEQAQAILDLIEENQQPEDAAGTGKMGLPSGPVW